MKVTKENTLSETIASLFKQVHFTQDRLATDITLMKMSDVQIDDLAAMIDFLKASGDTASYILGQVSHDLMGLKAGFLGLPEGDCFSPRSSGYAAKVS